VRGRRTVLLATVLTALLTAACTSSGDDAILSPVGTGTNAGTGAGSSDHGTPQQHAAYGYAAKASGVDYQPAVVVVGGGPSAIRRASADGLTWTIAAAAPGAKQLHVGSVMLVTSIAAGRVVAVHDEGDARVVTIAPVLLTDVIRNGKIDVHQALDPHSLVFQQVPGLAMGPAAPADGDLPPRFAAGRSVTGDPAMPPPSSFGEVIGIGVWKVKPYFDTNGKLGVTVEREKGGLKLTAEIAFTTSNLRIGGTAAVSGGVLSGGGFRIDGLTGLQVSFGAGTRDGNLDNGKVGLTVPAEFKLPIPPSPATAELPMTITVKFKFTLATALTGKNSTLLGSGKYRLSGPLGYDGSNVLTPQFSVEKSLLDSLSGITLGPSGLVLASNVKIGVGIGPTFLNAGPNFAVNVAFGATNGSSLGAPLARCRGVTLDIDGTYGASLNAYAGVVDFLRKRLPGFTNVEFGVEGKSKLLHRQQILPDVPLCRG